MRAQHWRRAQAGLISASFALLLVGTNAVNPLLPIYRTTLHFDALLLSLTYVAYVIVLTAFFVVMARPSFGRWAPQLIISALALAAVSDALLWTATAPGVLLGRALSGVAGGMGAGAASALVVEAIGDRGRAVTATGNLVGAVIGAGAAQLAVLTFGESATHIVFLVHGAACGAMGVTASIPLYIRRRSNRHALRTAGAPKLTRADISAGRKPLACGSIAWVALSLTVVLLPATLHDRHLPTTASAAVVLVLACSAVAQLAAVPLTRIAPWLTGLELLAAGLSISAVSLLHPIAGIAIVGIAVTGAGIGVAYRAALVHLVRGAPPATQSALASLYGAVTYGAAAVVTLLSGILAQTVSLLPAVTTLLLTLSTLALTLSTIAPRARTTNTPTAHENRPNTTTEPDLTHPACNGLSQ
ncbi:MFS transporter [Williamsia sp. SKLECPSW1]